MKYKVVQDFVDAETGINYKVGDEYPKQPTVERIAELMGDDLTNFDHGVIESDSEVVIPNKDSTVSEIKDYLAAQKIDIPKGAKKDELLALVK